MTPGKHSQFDGERRIRNLGRSNLPELSREADTRIWGRVRAEFLRRPSREPRRAIVPLQRPAFAFASAIALCLCVVGVGWLFGQRSLVVARVLGEAVAGEQGARRALAGAGRVAPGTRITVSEGAFVDIADPRSGLHLRVTSGALSVDRTPRRIGQGRFAFEMGEGDVWVETDEQRFHGGRLELRTADLSVAVLGTVLRVTAHPRDGSSVEVLRGHVAITVADTGASLTLAAGQRARVRQGDVLTEAMDEAELARSHQRAAMLRAPSMILGTTEYFMPTDSLAPEMGLALGWDPARAGRVVDSDLFPGHSPQLRLIRGADISRGLLDTLERAARLEMQASASQDAGEASRLYVEAASELKAATRHRPRPSIDAPLLVFAAHLESAGAGRHDLALETLDIAEVAARETPLEPVVVMAKALLLQDRLRRPTEARELYRAILGRFDGSPEAVAARERLPGGASSDAAGS